MVLRSRRTYFNCFGKIFATVCAPIWHLAFGVLLLLRICCLRVEIAKQTDGNWVIITAPNASVGSNRVGFVSVARQFVYAFGGEINWIRFNFNLVWSIDWHRALVHELLLFYRADTIDSAVCSTWKWTVCIVVDLMCAWPKWLLCIICCALVRRKFTGARADIECVLVFVSDTEWRWDWAASSKTVWPFTCTNHSVIHSREI